MGAWRGEESSLHEKKEGELTLDVTNPNHGFCASALPSTMPLVQLSRIRSGSQSGVYGDGGIRLLWETRGIWVFLPASSCLPQVKCLGFGEVSWRSWTQNLSTQVGLDSLPRGESETGIVGLVETKGSSLGIGFVFPVLPFPGLCAECF